MSEEVIVKYCSPTLAGIKTGRLFSCSYNSKNEVCEFLRELNISLRNKGVRFMPLRFKNKKVLIYAYRPITVSFYRFKLKHYQFLCVITIVFRIKICYAYNNTKYDRDDVYEHIKPMRVLLILAFLISINVLIQ